MKHLFLTLVLATCLTIIAGVPPRLERTNIGGSGCSAYLPKGMPGFEMELTPDKAELYTSELKIEDFAFGCITVKFAKAFKNDSKEDLENMLVNYMQFLQTSFGITSTAGVGRGHKMESNSNAQGVIDYWADGQGQKYAVKGWVDENCMAVMYVVGPGDYPAAGIQEMYLNGFRFQPKPEAAAASPVSKQN
jgi:hypothetical protein